MRAMKSPPSDDAKAKRAVLVLQLLMAVGILLPLVLFFILR